MIIIRKRSSHSLHIWASFAFLWILAHPSQVFSQTDVRYDPWDWVTYKNSQFISSITEGREYIYFATNGGILRYQLFGKFWDYPVTRSQGLSDDEIFAIYYDFHTHILWASTPSGLDHSIDGGRRWESVSNKTLGLRPDERIFRIGSTSENLWCITDSQVLQLDHISGYVITPYAVLPEGEIVWGSELLKTRRSPLRMLNDYTATGGWINSVDILRGPRLEEVPVSTVYVDRFGDLWVGTWGGWAFYGNSQMRQLVPLPFGPAQTSSEILIESERGMWIGGIGGTSGPTGITLYDVARGYWDLFRVGYEITFGDDRLYCGVRVGEEWWFGTTNGIQIYTPSRDSWLSPPRAGGISDVRVTTIDYDGDYVYAGTQLGLMRLSPSSKSEMAWSVAERIGVRSIYFVHWDGTYLWVSTDINLWQWRQKDGQTLVHGMLGSSSTRSGPDLLSPITAIVSSDSMVYFGDGLGILAYELNTNTWNRLTGESRLVGFHVLDLTLSEIPEEDLLFLWMGTTQGIFAINLKTNTIRHFKKEDGLPSNTVKTSIIHGDVAWFGTPEGLVRFNWGKHLQWE